MLRHPSLSTPHQLLKELVNVARKKNAGGSYLKLTRAFLGIPNETLVSPELNKLSVHSRWLYMVLLTKFNREEAKSKQSYGFTYEEMREITKYDDRRIAFCVRELEKDGFIYVEHGGKNNPSRYRPVLRWLY